RVSETSARAGAAPATSAPSASAATIRAFTPSSIPPLDGSEELRDPERRVLLGKVAGLADGRAAPGEGLEPQGEIGVRIPDFLDGVRPQVAENRAPVEVGAAERDAAVPERREREPRAVARVVHIRFLVQRAGPVVQIRDVDLVGPGAPVLDERV